MGKIKGYKQGSRAAAYKGVDAKLIEITEAAIALMPYDAQIRSGTRGKGDKGNHSKGKAIDVTFFDENDKPIKDIGRDANSAKIYERFAQYARVYQQKHYPELNKSLRWGGGFSDTEFDFMHLDITHPQGATKMGLYSWDKGFNAEAKRRIPGLQTSGGLSDPRYRRQIELYVADKGKYSPPALVGDGDVATYFDEGFPNRIMPGRPSFAGSGAPVPSGTQKAEAGFQSTAASMQAGATKRAQGQQIMDRMMPAIQGTEPAVKSPIGEQIIKGTPKQTGEVTKLLDFGVHLPVSGKPANAANKPFDAPSLDLVVAGYVGSKAREHRNEPPEPYLPGNNTAVAPNGFGANTGKRLVKTENVRPDGSSTTVDTAMQQVPKLGRPGNIPDVPNPLDVKVPETSIKKIVGAEGVNTAVARATGATKAESLFEKSTSHIKSPDVLEPATGNTTELVPVQTPVQPMTMPLAMAAARAANPVANITKAVDASTGGKPIKKVPVVRQKPVVTRKAPVPQQRPSLFTASGRTKASVGETADSVWREASGG